MIAEKAEHFGNVVDLEKFFGEYGPLAKSIPGYLPREGQKVMAANVAHAIAHGGRLLVEAPTGVGKTFAYLVPIIMAGKTAIVVTANIALGEQIVAKDLPMLAKLTGKPDLSFALAKGLNNFVCIDALEDLDDDAAEDPKAAELVAWADRTKTGDISELGFVPSPKLMRGTTRSADECLKAGCKFADECFGLRARQKALNADIVVTNYHLYFAHLEVIAAGGSGVLPDADVHAFDEAHKMPEIARGFVGKKVTEFAIRKAANLLAPTGASRRPRPTLDAKLRRELVTSAERLFRELARKKAGRIKEPSIVENASPGLLPALRSATERYAKAIRDVTGLNIEDRVLFGSMKPRKLTKWYQDHREEEQSATSYVEQMRISGRSCVRYYGALKLVDGLAQTQDKNWVHYLERSGSFADKMALRSSKKGSSDRTVGSERPSSQALRFATAASPSITW
jgi:Rad3-related DNA helicase